MSQIILAYNLSTTGQQAALAAGRNPNHQQILLLRPPNYKPPTPPQDAIAAVQNAACGIPTNQPATPDLADAVKALTTAVIALAKALEPSTANNVTVVNCSTETWAAAAALAKTDAEGNSIVGIGYDVDGYGSTPYTITGYDVVEDRNNYNFRFAVRHATTSTLTFDAPQDVDTLLSFEKERRAALEPKRIAANEEAKAKSDAYRAEQAAQRLESNLSIASHFIERIPERFRHLPEVVALQNDITNRNPDLSYDYADRAVKRAQEQEAKDAKDAKLAWIEANGSELLQRLARENILDENLYKNERLAKDMPRWFYTTTGYSDGKKPSIEELRLLDKAREALPNAKITLGYVRLGKNEHGFRPITTFEQETVYFKPWTHPEDLE